MESMCMKLLAYDRYCPTKYRRVLWEPLRNYLDQAQACAEMAYLESDTKEKISLVRDARKYFRMFKRYEIRCDSTGEFRFGDAFAIDMVEYMQNIEEELNRWYAKLRKVSGGVAAASPDAPFIF